MQWSRDNDAYEYKSAALNVRLCLTFLKFLYILERELYLRTRANKELKEIPAIKLRGALARLRYLNCCMSNHV